MWQRKAKNKEIVMAMKFSDNFGQSNQQYCWTHQAISNSRMHNAIFVLGYQDGMVLLQSVDRSVNQRSKKQAMLPMPTPQWGSNALSSRILIQNHFSLMKVL